MGLEAYTETYYFPWLMFRSHGEDAGCCLGTPPSAGPAGAYLLKLIELVKGLQTKAWLGRLLVEHPIEPVSGGPSDP